MLTPGGGAATEWSRSYNRSASAEQDAEVGGGADRLAAVWSVRTQASLSVWHYYFTRVNYCLSTTLLSI